ncbi:MAG: hypothetical protein R3F65_30225 [bacterium]
MRGETRARVVAARRAGAMVGPIGGLIALLWVPLAAAAPSAPCFFYLDPTKPPTCQVTLDDAPAFVRRISAGAAAGDTAAVDAALAAVSDRPEAWCWLATDEGSEGEGRARRRAVAHRYVADVAVHALATRRWQVAAECAREAVERAPDDRARAAALHDLARAAAQLDPKAQQALAQGTVAQSDNVFVEIDPRIDPVERLFLRAFLADPSHARLARVSAPTRARVEQAVAALDAPAAVPLLGPFADAAAACQGMHADYLARRRVSAGDERVCTLAAGRVAAQLVSVYRVFAVEDEGEGRIECLASVYAVVPDGERWYAVYVGAQSHQSERDDLAGLDRLGGAACNIPLGNTFARVEPVRLPAIDGHASVAARALDGDIARAEGEASLVVRDVVCVDAPAGCGVLVGAPVDQTGRSGPDRARTRSPSGCSAR